MRVILDRLMRALAAAATLVAAGLTVALVIAGSWVAILAAVVLVLAVAAWHDLDQHVRL